MSKLSVFASSLKGKFSGIGEKVSSKVSSFKENRAEKKAQKELKKQEKLQNQQMVQQVEPSQSFQPSTSGNSGAGIKKIILKILLLFVFPLVLVYNLIRTGKFFPNGEGKISAIFFSVVIIAALALALYPVIAPFGLSGIFSGASRGYDAAQDTVQRVSGAYMQQVQQAMGLTYATEIDKYADEDVGLSLNNVRLTQQLYTRADPVSIWGKLEGKSLSPERPIDAEIECWHEKILDRGTERLEGVISPASSFSFDRQMAVDFRCEFPQGILAEESLHPDRFGIRASFNFGTVASLSAKFMDYDAFYALESADPVRISEIQRRPVTKNTYAPVELSMGSQNTPFLIREGSHQSQNTIRFSITNKWNGFVRELSNMTVLVPRGVRIESCDAMTQLIPRTEYDDFIKYVLAEEGVQHISSRITSHDGARRFVPQGFNCYLDFDTDIIFENRNRLSPIELDILASIEYEYILVNDMTPNVLRGQDDLIVTLSPLVMGLKTTPEFSITESGFNRRLRTARFTLRHRKKDDILGRVVPEFANITMTQNAEGAFIGSIGTATGKTLGESITDLEKGDTLIFEFDVIKSNGEPYKTMRAVRILNNPPQVRQMFFEPSSPNNVDSLTCVVEAFDLDGDDIEDAIFIFNNRAKNIRLEHSLSDESVTCEKRSDDWLCIYTIQPENLDVGDAIDCSVTLYDGIDYNRLAERINAMVSIKASDSSPSQGQELPPCEGALRISERGITTGPNESGEIVSKEDYCVNENTLVEYFCDFETGLVTSLEYNCNCVDGACP